MLIIKKEASAGKSIILNGFLSSGVSLIFYFIGSGLFAYYREMPDQLNYAMENPDSIFPHFIMTKMPMGIAAIFAATMSTVSSNINSLSTAFTADVYQHFFKGRSDKTNLRVARLSGVLLGGVGILMALLMATWNILSQLSPMQRITRPQASRNMPIKHEKHLIPFINLGQHPV
ncbi:MAG: hypothetical protein JEZ14_15595 [Marinilabiliaceae bacterium]|nr:hypothetical protein [Marinilabiliaceae bacterium]